MAALAAPLMMISASGSAQDGMGTPEDQKNIIAAICGTQIKLSPQGCVCFAERAMDELDDPQRAYLILAVVQPSAIERLDIAHSQEDLQTIWRFIEAAHKSCGASAAERPGGDSEAPAADGPAEQ